MSPGALGKLPCRVAESSRQRGSTDLAMLLPNAVCPQLQFQPLVLLPEVVSTVMRFAEGAGAASQPPKPGAAPSHPAPMWLFLQPWSCQNPAAQGLSCAHRGSHRDIPGRCAPVGPR